MTLPKVSILVPTYNQERYIARAIASALAQDYPEVEVVVSDDASTDGTEAVVIALAAASPRLRYSRNPVNLGILRNYRKGLFELARGDWVINLDGDDFFKDQAFISKAIHHACSDDAIVLVFADYCEYSEGSGTSIVISNDRMPPVMEGAAFMDRFARDGVRWNHNSILYRRADALRIGFYWDEHEARNDWESFLRLVVDRRVGYLRTVAAAWSQHGANETRKLDVDKYINNFRLIDGVARFARSRGMLPEAASAWVAAMNLTFTRGCLIAYARNRDFAGACRYLRLVARVDPMLPAMALMSPAVLARAIIALSPGLYARSRALVRGTTA